MNTIASSQARFLIFTLPEHRPMYEQVCASLPYQVEYVAKAEEFLERCLVDPPQAALVDMLTGCRLGPQRTEQMFNLGVGWPVMRVTIAADGQARVMCLAPVRSGLMTDALASIAAGDPLWKHPTYLRRYYRLPVQARARIRYENDSYWQQGNLQSLNIAGTFVTLGGELLEVDDRIELELLDIGEQPINVHGRVAWRRTWEESPSVPGFGVSFFAETVPPELRTCLQQIVREELDFERGSPLLANAAPSALLV